MVLQQEIVTPYVLITSPICVLLSDRHAEKWIGLLVAYKDDKTQTQSQNIPMWWGAV